MAHSFATQYKIPVREVSDCKRVPSTALRRMSNHETGEIPSKTVFSAKRESFARRTDVSRYSHEKIPDALLGYVHSIVLKLKLNVTVTWN